METYDAIIIGAGHNGLVAALYLARAGWRTLVLERNDRIGGAVMSGQITVPGFIHDLFSTNQNLFITSPVFRELRQELARHGLRYRTSSKPFANVFPDGTALRVYQDVEESLDILRRHNPVDARGMSRLYQEYRALSARILPLFSQALPSIDAAWTLEKAAWRLGLGELLNLSQLLFSSTREVGELYLASPEARALFATWGMHQDFGPDVSGGAVFPLIEIFSEMEHGMAITQGGASNMVEALAGLLREYGGQIRTGAEVSRVLTTGDRATGVELESGEQLMASRAVIANTTPTLLFGRLLADHPFARSFVRKVRKYQFGPGTMMIHLALSGRPTWAAGAALSDFAYIHIAPYVEDLARTYTAAANGYLPASPAIIVGQTSAVDPTRAPGNNQVLWIQVRMLPSIIRGDVLDRIGNTHWDEVKEPVADRVLDKLETYAPGIRRLILDRVVFSPLDLERRNINLQGGDSLSGSVHLRQNFSLRPVAGWSRYGMPLKHLYMVGAPTWPGPGVNATSGYLAAQELLHTRSLRELLRAAGVAAAAVPTAALLGLQYLTGMGDLRGGRVVSTELVI